ncbi:uncharacterized protein K460DRAFT_405853 [Cucurbitaria berberidis CBS 394.84]|uniref:Uncharacterized protein n=1 Tax=Cucurbitaria berberidis CBS 394.84 TaxID=1168544 RepID=A0A9P4L8T0_9PLEO|nr:uncharacterized protein K460DRAFT_405853 [Cucurbitaria berberidis CBS 394.84]KAF1845603.1 hypothetical protein K460DRAFT_405853 [Cucurbitaria berberidis CBS 394.84]
MHFTPILLVTLLGLAAAAPTAPNFPIDLEARDDCKYRIPCHRNCQDIARALDYCHCLTWCGGGHEEQDKQRRYDVCCATNPS